MSSDDVELDFLDNAPSEEVVRCATGIFTTLYPYFTDNEGARTNVKLKDDELKALALDALQGTSRIRMRGKISPTGEIANLTLLEGPIRAREPIPVTLVYGTAKNPTGDLRDNLADMADFSAIHALMFLNQRLSGVYPPGMSARIYYEDAVGHWLFGDNETVRRAQEGYYYSLVAMLESMEAAYGHRIPVKFVREIDILEGSGHSLHDFMQEAERLKPLFKAYLRDSDDLMEEHIIYSPYGTWAQAQRELGDGYQTYWKEFAEANLAGLESYKTLTEEGWNGYIPPEMRDFYFQRFRTNAQTVEDTYDGLVDHLARYDASALAKVHLRTARTLLPGENFNLNSALKLSLIKFPPGVPSSYDAVLQMRAILNHSGRGGVDTCTAPWRVTGSILTDKSKARIEVTSTSGVAEGIRYPANAKLKRGTNASIKADIGVR